MAGVAFVFAGMSLVDFKRQDVPITFVIMTDATGLGGLCDRRSQSQRPVIASLVAVVAPLPLPGHMLWVNFLPVGLFAGRMFLPAGLSARLMTEPAFSRIGAVHKLPSAVLQVRHWFPVILQDRIGMAETAVKLLAGVFLMQLFAPVPEFARVLVIMTDLAYHRSVSHRVTGEYIDRRS